MSLRQALSLLLASVLVAGCMNVSSTLTVRPDGSGTITERLTLNPEMARMMQSLGQTFDSTGTDPGLFSEDELQAEADSVPGMRLQSFTEIDEETGIGYEAVYAFENLNDAQFAPGPGEDVLPDGAMEADESPLDLLSELSFAFTPGRPATLTVRMPLDPAEMTVEESPDTASANDDLPSETELEMVRAMMENAGFRVAVRVDGQIVETNATHRTGSTVTLMAMDFDTLAQDSTAFRELMSLSENPSGPENLFDRLNALPGVTIEPQETVTIRFR